MSPATVAPAAIAFGRFRVLPHRRELLADDRPVELGARAFDVLMALIEARGQVVTKDELMERVWPGRIVEENNLAIHVLALRKAFAADRGLIRTVFGRGYRFTGEIRTVSAPPDAPMTAALPDAPMTAALPDAPMTAALPGAAPPPTRPPTNLPLPVSELIGRDTELPEIMDLSASHRLVTLTGTGGIGKTRLGFEVARHQLPKFADGVWSAELAPSSDPDLVPITVATALGLEFASGMASPQSVANALRSKQIMLVLDNCEHVVNAAASMADALLRANPAVRVIATSREPLRIEGEWIYRVSPLAVPPEGSPETEDPLRYGAVRLFGERARAAAANLSSDARTASAIAGICRRLDGIPLAIELAAARAASLGIDGLAAGLGDRFRLLAQGRRTALPHHQTLQGTLDWSYELLTEPERVVLRRLAIFAGGFTLQAAGAVVADDEITAMEIVDCVADLVAKSLVMTDASGAVLRYRLLETTRAYALEKLATSGEFQLVARRHTEFYLTFFQQVEPDEEKLSMSKRLAGYRLEINDVRAALDWALSPAGDATLGVALTVASERLWFGLSLMDECRRRVESALSSLRADMSGDTRFEMQLCAALAAALYYAKGPCPEACAAWTDVLAMAERLDAREYRLRALWGLWAFRFNSGQHCVALTVAQKFYAVAATRPDPFDCLIGERMIGTSQYYLGELPSARRHIERVLPHSVVAAQKSEIARFVGDARVAALGFLARILWLQGVPDQAMRAAERCVAEARATNHAISLSLALVVAACPVALWVGDLAAAEHYVEMLLDNSTRHALTRLGAFGRCYQGMLAIQRGDLSNGLRLLRAALGEPAAAGSVRWLLTFIISAVSRHVRQIADGLPEIEEAITRFEHTEERWLIAELLRVKGELLLLRGEPGAAATAGDHFRQALDVARRQGALSWELRAATSLARRWRDQVRSKQARELLAPVYDRFTEGFATADLREAKSLLEELA